MSIEKKIFVDVESTGFDPFRESVIELATIITDVNGEELGTFHEYCRPDKSRASNIELVRTDKNHGYFKRGKKSTGSNYRWSIEAEKVHGIKYDFAIKQQHPIQMGVNWINFLSKHIDKPTPLSMYTLTSAYDLRMITAMLNKNLGHHYFKMYKYVSHHTYENVEQYVPSSYSLKQKQRNLEYVARSLELNHDAHNALSDTRATIEIWKKWSNQDGERKIA